MPIHDWSRVEANLFHHFHQAWTMAICNALNGGLLPDGYSALVEQHAFGLVPDVLALQRTAKAPNSPTGSGTVLVTPPKTRHIIQARESSLAGRANRVTIQHPVGQVISLIEVVSPGNKSGRAALRSFVSKTLEFLEVGIHVLLVDLFPPSTRDPQGIHKAIWDEIEESDFALSENKQLTLAAYVAGIPIKAYVEPVAPGDALPDMPAYLDESSYVPVPLEATYQSAWLGCPKAFREVVEANTVS